MDMQGFHYNLDAMFPSEPDFLYPDAVTIYRMANEVWNMLAMKAEKDMEDQWKNMLQIMVCQEMYVRRRRHDKFCRKFVNCGTR